MSARDRRTSTEKRLMATPGGNAPLVIIAMIGFLAVIAIPRFEQNRHKADKLASDTVSKEIPSATGGFYDRNGRWQRTAAALSDPKALSFSNHMETSGSDLGTFVPFNELGKESFRMVSFQDGEIQERVGK